jgi:hypothetical protein
MTVDDESAITAPVHLAALQEHDSAAETPGGGAASTRPDWLVVGAVAAGVAIVVALGTLIWLWSPVVTAGTSTSPGASAAPTLPPGSTSTFAPAAAGAVPTAASSGRPNVAVRVPSGVRPVPPVGVAPPPAVVGAPVAGGTTGVGAGGSRPIEPAATTVTTTTPVQQNGGGSVLGGGTGGTPNQFGGTGERRQAGVAGG